MSTTAIPTSVATSTPAPFAGTARSVRLLVVAALFLVLLAGAFATGRATAGTHTVRTVVSVPTAAPSPLDGCRLGRAC